MNQAPSALVDCLDCGCTHRRDVRCPWGPMAASERPAATIERTRIMAALEANLKPAAHHHGTRAQSIGTSLTGDLPAARSEQPARSRGNGHSHQPTKAGKAMTAKFPGTCKDCGQRFDAGTSILWIKGEGSRHATCPEQPVAAPVQHERAATPKMIALIETLQAERAEPIGAPEGLAFSEAHDEIERLLGMPKVRGGYKADLNGLPEGRYAVTTDEGHLAFYVVTERGVFVQASDAQHRVPGAASQAVIAKIQLDPAEASRTYGRELGHCGVCGRTLTDETSREHGIGPVCSQRTGW
jgi:hypothetical protein